MNDRTGVIALPNGAARPVPVPAQGTFARLDGIEKELDQLAAGTVELAAAVDAQAQAIVNQLADISARLDRIETTGNGSALALALIEPAVTDSLGIVADAKRIGWRKAWKQRRRQAKAAK